jgi:hypothetical protein
MLSPPRYGHVDIGGFAAACPILYPSIVRASDLGYGARST